MRRVIWMLAALLVLVPQLHSQPLTKIVISQPVASFSFLPLDYAKAAGLFEQAGFEVTQVATRGGGPDLAALVSGDVQFNAAPATMLVGAIRAKRDLLCIYNFYNRSLLDVVISTAAAKKTGLSPTAPLAQRAAALKGLTMAMTRPGAITDSQLRHLARVGGLGPDDIKIVAIGDAPSMLAALSRGQIDGFTISIPGGRIAVDRGEAVLWVNNAAGDDPAMSPLMFQSIHTTREYASAHADIVKRFVAVVRKAVLEIQSKPTDAVLKTIQPVYEKTNEKVLRLAIDAVRPALNAKGDVSLEMARNTVLLEGSTDVTAEQLLALYTPAYQ